MQVCAGCGRKGIYNFINIDEIYRCNQNRYPTNSLHRILTVRDPLLEDRAIQHSQGVVEGAGK